MKKMQQISTSFSTQGSHVRLRTALEWTWFPASSTRLPRPSMTTANNSRLRALNSKTIFCTIFFSKFFFFQLAAILPQGWTLWSNILLRFHVNVRFVSSDGALFNLVVRPKDSRDFCMLQNKDFKKSPPDIAIATILSWKINSGFNILVNHFPWPINLAASKNQVFYDSCPSLDDRWGNSASYSKAV